VIYRLSWRTWRLLTALGLAVGMAFCQPGCLTGVCLGEEACPVCEPSIPCRIRAFCGRMMAPTPYRPFDDHYPRFHPVPTSPVFPSLYDIGAANVGATRPSGRSEAKAGPAAAPDSGAPEPAPLPELIPTPPAKVDGSPLPSSPPPQRQGSRRNWGAASWIFLPAETPGGKAEGHSGRAREMASEGERLVR